MGFSEGSASGLSSARRSPSLSKCRLSRILTGGFSRSSTKGLPPFFISLSPGYSAFKWRRGPKLHGAELCVNTAAFQQFLVASGFGNAAADTGQVDNVTWVAQVSNVSFGLDRVQVTASWRDGNGVSSLTVTDLVSMR